MEKKHTEIVRMDYQTLKKAFEYANHRNLVFYDVNHVKKSHVQFFEFSIKGKEILLYKDVSLKLLWKSLSLRIHPDFKRHYISEDSEKMVKIEKQIDDDFLEYSNLLSKSKLKELSKNIKRFNSNPTVQKASIILKLFPFVYELDDNSVSLSGFKQVCTKGISTVNDILKLTEKLHLAKERIEKKMNGLQKCNNDALVFEREILDIAKEIGVLETKIKGF